MFLFLDSTVQIARTKISALLWTPAKMVLLAKPKWARIHATVQMGLRDATAARNYFVSHREWSVKMGARVIISKVS